MKKNPFAIANLAAVGGLIALLSSCTAPATNTPMKGNPYIQKTPKGDIAVTAMALPPANLAPGTEYSTSTACLRAVIHDGVPKFQLRLTVYKPPGRTYDFKPSYLTWQYLQQQAAAGGLTVNLPAKSEAVYSFSPAYINAFLTDVDTAMTRPMP